MDNIINPTPKVTTGPLPASAKVYVTPDAAPDLRVPLREIELSSPSEPRMRVYDTTGPYTDSSVTIDVRQGLARTRRAWVLERGGVEEYDGRPIQADRQRQREELRRCCRSPTRRGRCAASPASRSPSSNGRARASSPRK